LFFLKKKSIASRTRNPVPAATFTTCPSSPASRQSSRKVALAFRGALAALLELRRLGV
jgi:hypothetical protein